MITIRHLYSIALILLVTFTSNVSIAEVGYENNSHNIIFSGYARGGIGVSEGHKSQAKFALPNARSAYRLGNEPDSNIELELQYAYTSPKDTKQKFKLVAMRAGYAAHDSTLKLDDWAQAYFAINDIWRDSNFWFGRRYYDRKDIHIMDHYWLNSGQNSHIGGGLENIATPVGTIDIALFQYRDENATDEMRSHTVDVRWRGIKINEKSNLTLWAQLSKRDKNNNLAYSNQNGEALGLWIDSESGNMKNTLALSVQYGSTITQSDFNPNPVREEDGWNLNSASVFEINNAFFYEVLPAFAIQASAAIRYENRGGAANTTINWYSAGVRPIIFLSNNISLAFEFGFDHLNDKVNNRQGNLLKETISIQFSTARGFYNRPILRLFATSAQWGDDFKGLVGHAPDDAPYATNTDGWTTGIQFEWWW